MGILSSLEERARQFRTGDREFLGFIDGVPLVYFFELRIPASIGGVFGTSFLFPLVLNPDDISFMEPFSVAKTHTMGGGLYVEEDGIVERQIRINGHTGFRPRKYTGDYFPQIRRTEQKSYSREVQMFPGELLSGHRHFQFLQDAVFRTYGDLKRDPSVASEVYLLWHNQKDDEHWVVVPENFSLERRASGRGRVVYEYTIDMTAIGKAEVVDADFSEDKGWLDAAKDVIRQVQTAIDLVNGAIQDITAIVNELKQFASDFDKVIGSVISIVDNVSNFIEGVVDAVEMPYNQALGIVTSLDDALGRFSDALLSGVDIPATIMQRVRQIGDGLDRILLHPEIFVTEAQLRLRRLRELEEPSSALNIGTLAQALPAPTSIAGFNALGTGAIEGDRLIAAAELGIGAGLRQYTAVEQHRLGAGDTLQTMASRFLGDARAWRILAVLNGLEAPYISKARMPNTKTVGDAILVPTTGRSPGQQAITGILGVTPDEPMADRLLGTDLALERKANGLFDVPIDDENGGTDAKLARGVANLSQALIQRATIEQGTDILYVKLGRKRITGMGIGTIDRQMAGFRISESVGTDPRIAAIRGVRFNAAQSVDVVDVDIDAEVRGFSEPLKIEVR